MEVVNTLEIDGIQWNIQDSGARNKIAELEQKKHIKITQLINEETIKLDLVEIDDEKFIRLRIWGYIWSGKIAEPIAHFTQNFGLKETTGCLMLGSKLDKTGRIAIHIDIISNGDLEIYPCLADMYSGTYSQCYIYGNAFIKI